MTAAPVQTPRHARDIPDVVFIAVVEHLHRTEPLGFVSVWTVATATGWPVKVVMAKLARLIRRKVLDGCPCGCGTAIRVYGWDRP